MYAKKIFALTLALLLAFSLAACVRETDNSTASPVTSSAPSPSASSSPSASHTDSEPTTTQNDLELGITTDTTYISEALGISFTLPAGWRFATNEEIALALQIGADTLADSEDFKAALLEQPYFFDVMAVDATGVNNFNIIYNDLAKTGIGAQISEATYGSLAESQLKQMSEAYKDAIFTHETLSLGEGEFVSLSVDATATSIKAYQRQYYKKVNQEYLVVITITGQSAEEVDKTAAMF